MKEKDFISIIKQISNSEYIGDDCAFLEDLGIVVTQDSLVEDVHFSMKYISPYQLGYKSVMVNVSDVAASGAEPKYLTIALSMPADVDDDFIKEFYKGAKSACGEDIKIVGGDITGGDKIFISVCAIGAVGKRKISSRKNAKVGYDVIVSGNHGSSAAGLELLLSGQNVESDFIKAHLEPVAQVEFGKKIAQNVPCDYAMMDTSDGLMDALSAIANESNVLLEIDFDKIPYDKKISCFQNWQDLILYGGEDYQLVAVVPKGLVDFGFVIGEVKEGLGVDLKMNGNRFHLSKSDIENKIFNHFVKG